MADITVGGGMQGRAGLAPAGGAEPVRPPSSSGSGPTPPLTPAPRAAFTGTPGRSEWVDAAAASGTPKAVGLRSLDLGALLQSNSLQDLQLGLTAFTQSGAMIKSLYPPNQVSDVGLLETLEGLSQGDPSLSIQVHSAAGALAGTSHARLLDTRPPIGVIEYAAASAAQNAPELLKRAIDALHEKGATTILIETPRGDSEEAAQKAGILKDAGFNALQFSYAQPALDSEGSADPSLTLAVLAPEGAEHHPMATSVLKDALTQMWGRWGVDVAHDEIARQVLSSLEGRTSIPVAPLAAHPNSKLDPGQPIGL